MGLLTISVINSGKWRANLSGMTSQKSRQKARENEYQLKKSFDDSIRETKMRTYITLFLLEFL